MKKRSPQPLLQQGDIVVVEAGQPSRAMAMSSKALRRGRIGDHG